MRAVCLLIVLLVQPAVSQILLNSDDRAPTRRTSLVFSRTLSEPLTDYYTDQSPITINSNQDFEQITTTGTGVQEDPYVIERLYIVATGTQNSSISVSYTSVYFIIRDCYLETDWAGIEILQTASGTAKIENNTCVSNSDGGAGIVVWGAQNVTIVRNRCSNLAQGIHLNEAGRCYIAYNNITDNNYQGINIRYSHFNTIIGNIITNSLQHGLAFVGTSNYNVAHHNQFVNNGRDDTYRIDGEPRGELTSQGFDEGQNNTWYDAATEEGNWWSDYSGSGPYAMDGPSNSVDQYPNTVDDQPQSSGFDPLQIAVLISFVGGLVILLVWRLLRSKSSGIS
jgi:parallel beta-helix repeat protein